MTGFQDGRQTVWCFMDDILVMPILRRPCPRHTAGSTAQTRAPALQSMERVELRP
jgi:hypothetical protein